MFRTLHVVLSVLAMAMIAASVGSAQAGGYYDGDGYYGGHRSGDYGDRYDRGYRSHQGRSNCCDRRAVRYERSGRYRDDSDYGRPYRHSYDSHSYYGYGDGYSSYGYGDDYSSRSYYRSSYDEEPRYDGGYRAYDSYGKCAPHRIRDIGGGWIWTVRAGCPSLD